MAAMTPSELNKANLRAFLTSIEPMRDGYADESFSFVATKLDDAFTIVRGVLVFNVKQNAGRLSNFQSDNILAGRFSLNEISTSWEKFLEDVFEGTIETTFGKLKFRSNASGHYGTHFKPFHEDGLLLQKRLNALSIFGDESSNYLKQPQLDWELRAAATPYDGLQDLLAEFQPGPLRDVTCIEVIALNVVGIDPSSEVIGETASFKVQRSHSASAAKTSVGYRILDKGKVVVRGQLEGDCFEWTEGDGQYFGKAEIEVPRASIVHAIASYNAMAQHHFYFGDPNCFQNPRRAIYESFDPKCAQLTEILAKTQSNRPLQREFEGAMPWLFWMLGFAPAHIGAVHTDAADFVMSAPNGHIAVIECTIGILKEESKLVKLHARTELVRNNLKMSNAEHLRVLPIIITAKSMEVVRAEFDQADRLGIYVITRETIDQLINRTLLFPNADQLYEQAENTVNLVATKQT